MANLAGLFKDVSDWLIEHKIGDTSIYYQGDRYNFHYNGTMEVEKDIDVRDYIEYCNPHTITMSFEGDLYELLNYEDCMYPPFYELFKKNGYSYELGNAWNLAAYEW